MFSHPSKLELIGDAQRAGYTVSLHIVMVPEDLAVSRVADRVEAGGHLVPEAKVRGRYARLWDLLAQARHLADHADFYDNSSIDHPFRLVASDDHGHPVGRPEWPCWTPGPLLA